MRRQPVHVGAERPAGGLGEDRGPGAGHVRVGGEHRPGVGARLGGKAALARQAGVAEVGDAALAQAEQRALSAQLEIDVGELEAVRDPRHRIESGPCLVGRRVREQHAVALVRAPPHPPAQLVQLGQAEEVGLLDHHHRRVRDVDAHLDHRRRHEHLRHRLCGTRP